MFADYKIRGGYVVDLTIGERDITLKQLGYVNVRTLPLVRAPLGFRFLRSFQLPDFSELFLFRVRLKARLRLQ